MRHLRQCFTPRRALGLFGLAAVAACVFLAADTLELAALWCGIAALALLGGALLFWSGRYFYRRGLARRLGAALAREAEEAAARKQPGEVNMLRKSMIDAINTIKTSRLGRVSGAAALYELPWYMIIGNPSAGKSCAIANSGLHFPIAGNRAIHGVAGTRNCDWFFTTDGILLDTAGRYAVEEADRAEWFSFLGLLRKYRKRAPINGVLLAVSLAELVGGSTDESVELAKRLRTRVQEMTERLGVFAPVYVVFTKIDLVAGFRDFFHDSTPDARKRAWGATLRYNRRSSGDDVLAFFDQHFDELHDGLKELSLAQMEGNRSAKMRPGVFTFPLEFAAIKRPLRAFLATLFEENTYQFKPIFRGFYFASAVQEGEVREQSSRRVAGRFDLDLDAGPDRALQQAPADDGNSGFFLHELFRNIVFADRDLVARYTHPAATRIKVGAFLAAAIVLGGALGGWTWSTINNRQLVANVRADYAQVRQLQDTRSDLQSRLEALEILQDRLEQLDRNNNDGAPLKLRFGLYQGERLARQLRQDYLRGMNELMLAPVVGKLEAFLAETVANADGLQAAPQANMHEQAKTKTPAPASAAGQPHQETSPTDVSDAYNALKTYLMLADKSLAEPGHLNDQLTRYWRGWLESRRGAMPREKMIRSAERLMTYYLAQMGDPGWPQARLNLALRDGARDGLNRVMQGTPAHERVYNDIKARAATRHAGITVAGIVGVQDRALLLGSHAVSGAFTRDAWEKFVKDAIREAANTQVRIKDPVLNKVRADDLTLSGSPEQIDKALTAMYKADYIREWTRFVQGVAVAEFDGFDASVQAMNRLGDPQTSPLARLLRAIDHQTAWDRDVHAGAAAGRVQRGLRQWFREAVLRRTPSAVRDVAPPPGAAFDPGRHGGQVQGQSDAGAGAGAVGQAFSGLARLVAPAGIASGDNKGASLLGGYLDMLSRLRSRLNQIKNQGDPGPGARLLMQQTLAGAGSELADALKYVDEHMMAGMSDAQRQVLRPILVRPLTHTFAMVVLPSEAEINKTWQAQVLAPFHRSLQGKFPFTPGAPVEASAAEIGLVFGPQGAIANFVATAMGPLVVRRGDTLAARTWADMGLTLPPGAVADFPGWVAPLDAQGVAPAGAAQTAFQLLPLPSAGTRAYTIEIDGQILRYDSAAPQPGGPAWFDMVHPGPSGPPGARISAVGDDGRSVELFNEPGPSGLRRLIDAAHSRVKEGRVFELRWTKGALAVGVALRITSSPPPGERSTDSAGNAGKRRQGFTGLRLPQNIVGRETANPAPDAAPASAPAPAPGAPASPAGRPAGAAMIAGSAR